MRHPEVPQKRKLRFQKASSKMVVVDWAMSYKGLQCTSNVRRSAVPPAGPLGKESADQKMPPLDGRTFAIVIAESLARVIAAIRIASVRWRSYLPRKHRY